MTEGTPVKSEGRPTVRPTVTAELPDGSLAEMVYDPAEHRTSFCVANDGEWRTEKYLLVHGERLVPYSPNNNLLRHDVVLLPSAPQEYDSEEELVAEIQAFIHRYVDVSPFFEKIACYYVLLSWVYDAFNELPYLRLRGDPGSGKTRFLLAVGALCYKPIFTSGASTVSPLFRILDAFRGTLIIDEGDFRFSDERAEIIKILNSGNAKGFPVLRSEVSGKREFDPRAYTVFGPKLVATRGFFDDRALESRCLTEEMGQLRLRSDIPISMPPQYKAEALALRNKLLLFRFRNLDRAAAKEPFVDRTIEPRLNQVFAPLLAIVSNPDMRQDLQNLARRYNRELIADRGLETEAQLLEVIRGLLEKRERLSVSAITVAFGKAYGQDYDRKPSTKWVGGVIRRKLQLKTQKSHGVFVLPPSELPKLTRLFEKYGVEAVKPASASEEQTLLPPHAEVDLGDVGDINEKTTMGETSDEPS